MAGGRVDEAGTGIVGDMIAVEKRNSKSITQIDHGKRVIANPDS